MSRNVLLARPRPFFVSEMKPFLEQNGYTPTPLAAFADLLASMTGAAGAIISLAVISAIGESAETIFTALRKSSPRLPVLFASIIDLATARSAMERLAKNAGVTVTILGIDAASESNPALGKPDTFLFLNKDDLISPERRALATRIIKRHFR